MIIPVFLWNTNMNSYEEDDEFLLSYSRLLWCDVWHQVQTLSSVWVHLLKSSMINGTWGITSNQGKLWNIAKGENSNQIKLFNSTINLCAYFRFTITQSRQYLQKCFGLTWAWFDLHRQWPRTITLTKYCKKCKCHSLQLFCNLNVI